jgi:hypothetical protein
MVGSFWFAKKQQAKGLARKSLGREGESFRGAKIPRGYRPYFRVKPVKRYGSLAGKKLRSREFRVHLPWTSVSGCASEKQRQGSKGSERSTARQRGKTSKGEPHERSWHEIRPGRLWEEETVKKVKNLEDGTD